MQQPSGVDTLEERVEMGDLVVFPARCEAMRRGRTLRLGQKECCVLKLLLQAHGRVVSLADLTAATWGDDDPAGAARVRGVIQRLRAKLRAPNCILTIGGEGYCIDIPGARG